MKKITTAFLALAVLASPAHAVYPNTWSLGASPGGPDQSLAGHTFKASPYLTAWGGYVRQPGRPGYYFQAAIPLKDTEWRYTYTLLNAGVNLPVTRNVILYAGGGVSLEEARVSDWWGYTYRIRENSDQLNGNAGIIVTGTKYGFNVGYNTASESFDIGFAARF
jgi:opacity protein-like surface antigen